MLKKRNRVRRTDFEAVFKKGKKFHSPHFSLRIAFLTERTFSAACVVSKKVERSAVGRNKTRRRCYAVLRQLVPQFKTPFTAVVVVTRPIGEQSLNSIRGELAALFERAGVL